MRPFKFLFPLFLCLLLAGCGQTEAPTPAQDSPAPAPDFHTEAPPAEEEPLDPHDLEIVLPEEYRDLLLITTEFEETDEHRVPLLSVQEKASVEAMEKDYGSGAGGGFLFGITAMDQVGFEQFLQYDYSGCDVFARDEAWYYAKTYPTDVQFYRSGGVIDSETEDWKMWETLNALGDQVCQDVITRNGLTPYSQWAVFDAPFTWEGDHAYAKYYTYYTFDGSKDQFDTLLLSQPAKQGEGGLWCVERFYDEYGSLYLYFPKSDVPAAEYYAALQAECDSGQHPELLTPLGAARDFVSNSGWYSDTATDENVELTDIVDSDYSEVNRTMSRVISALLVRPEEVTDQEVLDCVGRFRADTWGVMGRRFYGSDWWPPLQAALERAAVGDKQAERDQCMMRFYLTSYGRYADFIGGLLQTQQAAASAAFDEALEIFDPAQQDLLKAAVT